MRCPRERTSKGKWEQWDLPKSLLHAPFLFVDVFRSYPLTKHTYKNTKACQALLDVIISGLTHATDRLLINNLPLMTFT